LYSSILSSESHFPILGQKYSVNARFDKNYIYDNHDPNRLSVYFNSDKLTGQKLKGRSRYINKKEKKLNFFFKNKKKVSGIVIFYKNK
jgi:hypothetical protein